jgi:hypothetical protein
MKPAVERNLHQASPSHLELPRLPNDIPKCGRETANIMALHKQSKVCKQLHVEELSRRISLVYM